MIAEEPRQFRGASRAPVSVATARALHDDELMQAGRFVRAYLLAAGLSVLSWVGLAQIF